MINMSEIVKMSEVYTEFNEQLQQVRLGKLDEINLGINEQLDMSEELLGVISAQVGEFFWAHFVLSLWSEIFCPRVHMHKPAYTYDHTPPSYRSHG